MSAHPTKPDSFPQFIVMSSLRDNVSRGVHNAASQPARRPVRGIVSIALVAVLALVAGLAHASEKPQRCSFVYINGDAVISCPKSR